MATTHEISRNLGGNRLGSGDKNNIHMHAYNRSTHDLSRAWRSTMNVGTLVPFFVEPAMPGDTFSIDLEALVRTIPTIGPLYGSYKLQLDVFNCPVRLYNGLLHNNMMKIGLEMANVKLPKIILKTKYKNPRIFSGNRNQAQISSDCLLNYLGISGIGDCLFTGNPDNEEIERKFNAVPILAYYDIYKNYYINKQEDKGYFIGTNLTTTNPEVIEIKVSERPGQGRWNTIEIQPITPAATSTLPAGITPTGNTYNTIGHIILTNYYYNIKIPNNFNIQNIEFVVKDENNIYGLVGIDTIFPNWSIGSDPTDNPWNTNTNEWLNLGYPQGFAGKELIGIAYNGTTQTTNTISLKEITTDELDQQRIDILKDTGIGNETKVNNWNYEPWKTLCGHDTEGQTNNYYNQIGLAIKTYQSDLFNNWLKTEWIDGTPGNPGISQITAIDTSSGNFTIDALNLAQKVYNMLNRIAVSGGSYEDFIEAVYSTTAVRRAETPIYMGGLASEIVFQEVVSTAATEGEPLGSLAGKGIITNKKGGHIEIKNENEHTFIIGIVSITPRLDYSQGNKWWMTELDSVNDFHKPELDGIGFEDLLQENMAWWGTYWDDVNKEWIKKAVGKVPAWIKYMSAVNDSHGGFAEELKNMWMTLNRRYEFRPCDQDLTQPLTAADMGIADPTTYINPTKYNYTFTDTTLESQNFWVQIGIKCEARRVMSAKIIPTL